MFLSIEPVLRTTYNVRFDIFQIEANSDELPLIDQALVVRILRFCLCYRFYRYGNTPVLESVQF